MNLASRMRHDAQRYANYIHIHLVLLPPVLALDGLFWLRLASRKIAIFAFNSSCLFSHRNKTDFFRQLQCHLVVAVSRRQKRLLSILVTCTMQLSTYTFQTWNAYSQVRCNDFIPPSFFLFHASYFGGCFSMGFWGFSLKQSICTKWNYLVSFFDLPFIQLK